MDLDRLLRDLGWRPEARPSKFIAYFHLVDACGKPGCPVCRCLRELTVRSLDALLYEQVNDPGTRAVLDRSWGFCSWHAWMSTDVRNSALGIGLIYQGLLGQVRAWLSVTHRELSGSRIVRGWRRLFRRAEPVGLVQARANRARCPLCTALASAEDGYLHTLLDYIEDAELDRAYDRSDGLCLQHLTLALGHYAGHHGAAPLVARTLRKLDRLARDLREFIDKHDYRKQAPFTPEEAASWTAALTFLVGWRELFGNEIPRSFAPTPPAPGSLSPREPGAGPPESAEAVRERLEALAFEKGRLELRLRELTQQLGDESSRASALHYRLWSVSEDRQVLEMNLAGERAAAQTWEAVVRDLRAEIEQLKARLAKYEPPSEKAPDDGRRSGAAD